MGGEFFTAEFTLSDLHEYLSMETYADLLVGGEPFKMHITIMDFIEYTPLKHL